MQFWQVAGKHLLLLGGECIVPVRDSFRPGTRLVEREARVFPLHFVNICEYHPVFQCLSGFPFRFSHVFHCFPVIQWDNGISWGDDEESIDLDPLGTPGPIAVGPREFLRWQWLVKHVFSPRTTVLPSNFYLNGYLNNLKRCNDVILSTLGRFFRETHETSKHHGFCNPPRNQR